MASIHGFIGDTAFNNQDFFLAKRSYKESNDYSQSLTKEIGYAICIYHASMKNIKEDYRIDLQDIDYKMLRESEKLLEEIYLDRTDDTVDTIAKISFPYLFNIYSLEGKFDETMDIVNECYNYIDFNNENLVRLVVQAQVINKEYDSEIFAYLGKYDKIKYESFYYERCEDFKKAYQLVLQAIEGKYSDDKLLQLSLLNCLQGLDRFDDYLYYFKRFMQKETDEVLWLNYIEYLDKIRETETVISELKKIKHIANNPVVINKLLHLLVEYNLSEELDEYFTKVDSGEYPVIEDSMSQVIYQKLMHSLKNDDYDTFYEQYGIKFG